MRLQSDIRCWDVTQRHKIFIKGLHLTNVLLQRLSTRCAGIRISLTAITLNLAQLLAIIKRDDRRHGYRYASDKTDGVEEYLSLGLF